jgi:hypothetical protein
MAFASVHNILLHRYARCFVHTVGSGMSEFRSRAVLVDQKRANEFLLRLARSDTAFRGFLHGGNFY